VIIIISIITIRIIMMVPRIIPIMISITKIRMIIVTRVTWIIPRVHPIPIYIAIIK